MLTSLCELHAGAGWHWQPCTALVHIVVVEVFRVLLFVPASSITFCVNQNLM